MNLQVLEKILLIECILFAFGFAECARTNNGILGIVVYAAFWIAVYFYSEIRKLNINRRVLNLCNKALRANGVYRRVESVIVHYEKLED